MGGGGDSVSLCINAKVKVPTWHKAWAGFVCRLAHRSENWLESHHKRLKLFENPTCSMLTGANQDIAMFLFWYISLTPIES